MVDERKGNRKLWEVFYKGFGPVNGIQDPHTVFLQSDGGVGRFFREPAIIRIDGEQGFLDDTIDFQVGIGHWRSVRLDLNG